MRVFELNGGADVSGSQFADGEAIATVEQINLADAFGDAACAVVQFHPGSDRAGVDSEKRELAEVLFVHGFEDLDHRF